MRQRANLPNRRYFNEMLKRCIAKAERHEHKLAVLYIDLDKFKPINDQFGHEKGDFVLREIAKRLTKAVRTEDFVARVGGDEFAILVYPAGDKAGLCQLAERIVLQCHQPMIDASGNEFVVSASVGVAAGCRHLTLTRLFQRADIAMYEAKHQGGDAYHFASD